MARPYVVTKKINNLVYLIQLGPGIKPKVVHKNKVWKYSSGNHQRGTSKQVAQVKD